MAQTTQMVVRRIATIIRIKLTFAEPKSNSRYFKTWLE
ncbi:hypothetical protein AJ90_12250 [Vibrio parahaemolyticus M0605]|nr:hypothetical protein AJ90_12250 [Vibrio parahaemolyticus M0605]